MVALSRACRFVIASAVVLAAAPVDAAMTMVFGDGRGNNVTFAHDGNRIRVGNAGGEEAGSAAILDLETSRYVIVYDEVKAYYDVNKALANVRPIIEEAVKASERASRKRGADTVSYRALGKSRTINGFSCVMYERRIAGRVDAEICFAPWGDSVGQQADFAWVDATMQHMARQWFGETSKRRGVPKANDEKPGLAIWTSSITHDGTRDVTEIVKISRDPLPPAMFTVPADYKETSRPLSASERIGRGPMLAGDVTWRPAPQPTRSGGVSGLIAIVITVLLVFGLLVHSAILHLAASLVIRDALFTQALVAAIISWVVLIAVELVRLPPVVSLGACLFTTFAALKIAYSASVPRTMALFLVSGLIAALARYGAGSIGALLGVR